MADPRRGRASWAAAALAAPAAAGMFLATTHWSLTHGPHPAPIAVSAIPTSAGSDPGRLTQLRVEVAADRGRVDGLARALAALRTQLTVSAVGAAGTVRGASGGVPANASFSGGGRYQPPAPTPLGGGQGAAAPVAVPARPVFQQPVAAPASKPVPTVHATTGASVTRP